MTPADAPCDGMIFDLDGTLWDSTETVAAAWTRVVRRMGQARRTIPPAEIAAVMGKPHREICRALFAGLPERDQEALALACYAEEELAVHRQGGRLYAGVPSGLAALAGRLPLFIVSNCQRGYIEAFLAWSGLGPHFRDHECHGNTGATKAENLRSVIARNGLRAPWYVGDTAGDRDAAQAAGVPFIHAAYGFGAVPEATHRIEAFNDLVTRLNAPRTATPH